MKFDAVHAGRSIDFVSVSDFVEESVLSLELNAGDRKVHTCIAAADERTAMSLGCQQNLAGLMTPCRLPCLLKLSDWFLLLLEYFWLFQCTSWKTKWDRHGYKTEDLLLSRYLGDYHCYFPVGMHYN